MNRIKKIISASIVAAGLVGVMTLSPVMQPATANAAICAKSNPIDCASSGAGDTGTKTKVQLKDFIKNIVNILLYIIGVIAVIMIIVGGLRYVTSGGDSSGVSGAKNTILYAVVGLVVAVLAYAIVNFVLANIK